MFFDNTYRRPSKIGDSKGSQRIEADIQFHELGKGLGVGGFKEGEASWAKLRRGNVG